jgi:hypothetical protein
MNINSTNVCKISVIIIINQISLLPMALQDFWYLFVVHFFSGGETYKYRPIGDDIIDGAASTLFSIVL